MASPKPKSEFVDKSEHKILIKWNFPLVSCIKLIEKDKEILDQLKKYFRCGSIYFQRDKRPNHQQCYRYEVFNWKDLRNIIIPFFQKYQLKFASKRNDFKIFCDIMNRIERGEHKTNTGLKNLCKIKAKMH